MDPNESLPPPAIVWENDDGEAHRSFKYHDFFAGCPLVNIHSLLLTNLYSGFTH